MSNYVASFYGEDGNLCGVAVIEATDDRNAVAKTLCHDYLFRTDDVAGWELHDINGREVPPIDEDYA